MPTPAVCRAVHYVAYGTSDGKYPKACRAATITEVDGTDNDLVGLAVLNPGGLFFKPLSDGGCRYQDPESRMSGPDGGTWHWPERVGD